MNLRKFHLAYLKGKISTGASWNISKIHITQQSSTWKPALLCPSRQKQCPWFSVCAFWSLFRRAITCCKLKPANMNYRSVWIFFNLLLDVLTTFSSFGHMTSSTSSIFIFSRNSVIIFPYSTWKVFFKNIQFPSNVNVLQHSRVPLRRPDLFRYW